MRSARSSACSVTALSERPASTTTKSNISRACSTIWRTCCGVTSAARAGSSGAARTHSPGVASLIEAWSSSASRRAVLRATSATSPAGGCLAAEEQRRVAELQVHVDQRDAPPPAERQQVGEVRRDEGGAAAALARDE